MRAKLPQLKQDGVALITVMLIVALATVLAVSMSSRQQIDIHRSSNILNFEQGYQYVLGAEAWAQQILKRDLKKSQIDSLQEEWAMLLPPLPIEGGTISGQIEDLQSRFNINNLIFDGKLQKLEVDRFKKLLRNLQLKEDLVNVITDWIDPDVNLAFSGAEDNEYLMLSQAYRTANQPMADISELLLIQGVDREILAKLRPFVCVLKSKTNINVNTASAEILSSLAEDLSLVDAKTIVADREKKGYATLDEFLQQALIKNTKIKKDGLSVNSEYFQLNSSAQIDRIKMAYVTILQRESKDSILILKRSRETL